MADARSLVSPQHASPNPRRTFVARLAGMIAALPVLGRVRIGRTMAATMVRSAQQPNALLMALADAVLPSELGTTGVGRAAAEFQRWMDGFQPGAEANHGYGTGKIERLTADPRPQWREQLMAFDAEARKSGGQSFTALSRQRRQEMIQAVLAGERGDSLPTPLAAKHVSVALLAHFYDSPAATDLCYDARIGRQTCRPLTAQAQQPVSIGRRAR